MDTARKGYGSGPETDGYREGQERRLDGFNRSHHILALTSIVEAMCDIQSFLF
jgi:hypothetical protein